MSDAVTVRPKDWVPFRCRLCGSCCRDLRGNLMPEQLDAHRLARFLRERGELEFMEDFYTKYTYPDMLEGFFPIFMMNTAGPDDSCVFLENGRCSVHDCKPTVCALFPLGRVIIGEKFGEPIEDLDNLQVKYMLNEHSCGSAKRVNTVRSWLARFGIPEHDEFYLLWNKVLMSLTPAIMKLEEAKVSEPVLSMFWDAIYQTLYLQYDTNQDFMPQFQAAADKLLRLSEEIMKAQPPAHQEA